MTKSLSRESYWLLLFSWDNGELVRSLIGPIKDNCRVPRVTVWNWEYIILIKCDGNIFLHWVYVRVASKFVISENYSFYLHYWMALAVDGKICSSKNAQPNRVEKPFGCGLCNRKFDLFVIKIWTAITTYLTNFMFR